MSNIIEINPPVFVDFFGNELYLRRIGGAKQSAKRTALLNLVHKLLRHFIKV